VSDSNLNRTYDAWSSGWHAAAILSAQGGCQTTLKMQTNNQGFDKDALRSPQDIIEACGQGCAERRCAFTGRRTQWLHGGGQEGQNDKE
jgi:hypothetical protein